MALEDLIRKYGLQQLMQMTIYFVEHNLKEKSIRIAMMTNSKLCRKHKNNGTNCRNRKSRCIRLRFGVRPLLASKSK